MQVAVIDLKFNEVKAHMDSTVGWLKKGLYKIITKNEWPVETSIVMDLHLVLHKALVLLNRIGE